MNAELLALMDDDENEHLDLRACDHANRLLGLLSPSLPKPELSVDNDGAVCLEWYNGVGRVLSVSVEANSDLTYAWLCGGEKGHGVWAFHNTVPADLICIAKKVMQEGT